MASITSNQNNSFVFKGWGYGTVSISHALYFVIPTFAVAQGWTGKNKSLKPYIETWCLVVDDMRTKIESFFVESLVNGFFSDNGFQFTELQEPNILGLSR